MDSLTVKVVSWSHINSTTPGRSSMQAFGYDHRGRSVYVKFPYKKTLIVKYNEDLDEKNIEEINESLSAEGSETSIYFRNIAIVTEPTNVNDVLMNEEYIVDPYGPYTTFFQKAKIKPYSTLSIERYYKFPTITTQSLHYRADYQNVRMIDRQFSIPHRLLFWDIETYTDADEFTNPNRDPVTLISAVTLVGKERQVYLFSRIKINAMKDVKIVHFNDEKGLIEGFFNFWSDFKPDRSITYNGLSYDIPYMIARAANLGITVGQLGKIQSLNAWTINHLLSTPVGPEMKERFSTPGVEELDLITYFRLKYPWLPNHKLDTVAYNLLGRGKTGLSIERMFEIFRKGDREEMKEAAEYSIMDAILLHELYEQIIDDLEDTANSYSVTIEELLLSRPESIIDKQIYNLDPGLYFYSGARSKNNGDYTMVAEYGAYRNIYIYDYSKLINKIMRDSKDNITSTLAKRSPNVGMTLTKALWDSRVTQTDYNSITKYLDKINEDLIIVEVNKNILASVERIDNELLEFKYSCKMYILLSKVSRYIIYKDGEKVCMGRSSICRPKYSLEEDMITEWIETMDNGESFEFPEISPDNDISSFIRNIKIYSYDDTSNVELRRKLFDQVKPITTFKNVRYVMTYTGPEVYKNQTTTDINIEYYNDELEKLYNKLNKIA